MFRFRKLIYLSLIILSGAVALIWSAVFSQIPGNILEVVFFDVGQGDSIFIETPNKKQVLIDGGPDKMVLEKLEEVMPFYDRTIDLMILTHPDADHLTGLLSVLEYFKVNHILVSGFENNTAVYQEWKKLIEERNIPVTLAQVGQRIVFPSGVEFDILWPDQSKMETISKANNASVVGRLIYNESEILLTGDIEKKIENLLSNQDLESDVLKIPHHGSKSSTGYSFLKAIRPKISVISVGENNRYGHPHQEVLERLNNTAIYRTDRNGDIKIFTAGNFFDIITEYES